MPYRIIKGKDMKAKESYKIEKFKAIAEDLDDEAYVMYNTPFTDLSNKEKREVVIKYLE